MEWTGNGDDTAPGTLGLGSLGVWLPGLLVPGFSVHPWGPASPPASGVRRRCRPVRAGRIFGIFSPVVPPGFPSVVSLSLCMFRGEPFFFFFNAFLYLPGC